MPCFALVPCEWYTRRDRCSCLRNADPVGFEGSPLSLEAGAARRLLVATNTSDSPARIQVRLDGVADVSRLTWEGITATATLLGDGTVAIDLPPVSGAIFQIR